MSARTRKPSKSKQKDARVKTMSFLPGNFIDYSALKAKATSITPGSQDGESSMNGKELFPNPPGYDRSCLKDIEFFLANCVNLAEQVEDKRAAKIVRLLCDARERTIRLRDSLRAD